MTAPPARPGRNAALQGALVSRGREQERPSRAGRVEPVRWLIVLVVALAVALGIVARVWHLGHDPIDADEAVAGMMARHLAAGHANAFFWGQRYGGVEPYLVAAAFWVGGPSVLALRLTPVVLDAVACLILWAVARRIVRRRELAALAAAAMWAVPQSAVWNSTLEYGFRGVTMVCGLAMLLFTRRVVERDRPTWDLVALGAFAGVGWWSSPEIVYFAIPCALWLAAWAWRRRAAVARVVPWAVTGVVAAGAGALPWLWDNVASGFPSLDAASYFVPSGAPGYGGRVAIFFTDALPMVFDLRTPTTGAWTLPKPGALAIYAVALLVLCAAAVWCVTRATAGAAVAAALVAYPFLFAAVPGSWIWESGRYTIFFVPLALLLVATAADDAAATARPAHRRAATTRPALVPAVAGVVVLGLLALSGLGLVRFAPVVAPAGVAFGPRGPDGPAEALASSLDRHHIVEGFADYWVAYKLDFVSAGRLRFVPAPPSPDRTPAEMAAVLAAPARDQAWLFVRPSPLALAEYVDSPVIQGPAGLSESAFVADLARLGVAYRTVRLGAAEAVICSRRVTFAEVGLRRH